MAKFPRFMALPVAAVMIVSACGGGGAGTGGSARARLRRPHGAR